MMKCSWLYLFLGIILAPGINCTTNPLEKAIEREFKTFFETGRVGKILKNVARELELKDFLHETPNEPKWNDQKVNLFCSTCAAGMNQVLKLENPTGIVDDTIRLCVELGFGTQFVCEGLINAHKDDMFYILGHSSNETGNDICGVIFVAKGCTSKNPQRVWEVTFPDTPKPAIDNTPYAQPGMPTMKVLHLADTHYDPAYTPGTSITCDEIYLCCRTSGATKSANDTAGYWGSYGNCDIPRWTLEATLQHAATAHPDIDFVIWTGDIIPHSVWENTKEGNLDLIRDTAGLIAKYFPQIPVYPAVGNHEGAPVNQFPQPYITDPEFDISWLYDQLKLTWGMWLPEEASKTVAYSAYYSVQIKPGLRILSINTNYCYGYNWWLILDSSDIAQELSHVIDELQKAEDAGESVYIIGHIPPGGSDCEFAWSHQFNRIVSRYENTISGLFFAHTHKDHFELFFDPENPDRAYETIYIGPSQTTYSDLNPGYRIYTIEGEYEKSKFRVLDHESWIMDLNSANALNETNFFKLYSAKEEYGLEDLSPSSWYGLVKEMIQPNSTHFNNFYKNYAKAGAPYLSRGCDDSCKSSLLCGLVTTDNSDHSKCDKLIYNKK